jgi:hypothetical protein
MVRRGNIATESPLGNPARIDEEEYPNCSSMYLLGNQNEIPANIIWNQEQLEKCRAFIARIQATTLKG